MTLYEFVTQYPLLALGITAGIILFVVIRKRRKLKMSIPEESISNEIQHTVVQEVQQASPDNADAITVAITAAVTQYRKFR